MNRNKTACLPMRRISCFCSADQRHRGSIEESIASSNFTRCINKRLTSCFLSRIITYIGYRRHKLNNTEDKLFLRPPKRLLRFNAPRTYKIVTSVPSFNRHHIILPDAQACKNVLPRMSAISLMRLGQAGPT